LPETVRFLIAHTNDTIADSFRRNIEALSPNYTAMTIRTVRECLNWCTKPEEDRADVLFLELELVNGQADLVFDRWVAGNCGPICVFLPPIEPGQEGRERALEYELDYLRRRATNVLDPRLPVDELVPTLAMRYAREVLVAKTAAQVITLQKRVRILTVLVALLGGMEVVPQILELFGMDSIASLLAQLMGLIGG